MKNDLGKESRAKTIVAEDPATRTLLLLAEQLSKSNIPILIMGETGTGRRTLARYVHANSAQRQGNFFELSCHDLGEGDLAIILSGGQTGSGKESRAEAAALPPGNRKGTLFLSDIEELSSSAQMKLLQHLENFDEYSPNSRHLSRPSVRLIFSATPRLEEKVQEDKFREDLFYQINICPLRLPPLRERRGDIPPLINHFLEKYSPPGSEKARRFFTSDALALMCSYSWPGNVLELENEVKRALALTRGEENIPLTILSEKIRGSKLEDGGCREEPCALKENLHHLERALVLESLEQTQGNKTRSAEKLGLSRVGLYKKMKRLGLWKGKKSYGKLSERNSLPVK